MGMCSPEDPLFTPLIVRKGPISSKRISSLDPLLRKSGNFSLYSLNFHQNFSSQAPKFWNFQLTSPKFWNFQFTSHQIWKFSVHKPPFKRQISVRTPHTLEILATHPYLKKVECRGGIMLCLVPFVLDMALHFTCLTTLMYKMEGCYG